MYHELKLARKNGVLNKFIPGSMASTFTVNSKFNTGTFLFAGLGPNSDLHHQYTLDCTCILSFIILS